MTITEALKLCGNLPIAREKWDLDEGLIDNKEFNCMDVVVGKSRIPHWNPGKDDLIADDWIIRTEWTL